MTADRIVDASAIAALLLDETTAEQVGEALEDQSLAAPVLIYFEFANVCVKKSRAFPEKRDVFRAAIERLHRMDIEIVEVNVAEVVGLADQHRLSAYDASYLWLALELDVPLVTLDARLGRAYAAIMLG